MDFKRQNKNNGSGFVKASTPSVPADPMDKKLNFGLWYIEHLSLFKKIIIGILLAVSAVSWGYFIVSFVYYLAFGARQDDKMIADMVNLQYIGHDYFINNPTSDIEVMPVTVFRGSGNKVDLILPLKNPNWKYWAEFDYEFRAGAVAIANGRDFILPGEEKYLSELAVELENANAPIDITVKNISWHRVNPKEIKDVEAYIADHLDIRIIDSRIDTGSDLKFSNKSSLKKLVFTVKNNTAYNYQNLKLLVLFMRGSGVTAVDSYVLAACRSGEEYKLELALKNDVGFTSEIKVIPQVNIFDNNVYLKFQ